LSVPFSFSFSSFFFSLSVPFSFSFSSSFFFSLSFVSVVVTIAV